MPDSATVSKPLSPHTKRADLPFHPIDTVHRGPQDPSGASPLVLPGSHAGSGGC